MVDSLANIYGPLVKKSSALYWNADDTLRAAIAISRHYDGGKKQQSYWYAYQADWDEFLSKKAEADRGLYVLGCLGRNEAYVLPYQWIHSRVERLGFTEQPSRKYWHILLYESPSGGLVLRLKDGQSESLDKFRIALAPTTVANLTA
jgi:hypothetical protein